MALQKAYEMANGLVAPDAYTVIMLSQRNKVLNRIEAEVHVYASEAHRHNVSETNPPLHRFLHLIEDDARPQINSSYHLRLIGLGDLTILHGEIKLLRIEVTEETALESIVDEINQAEIDLDAQLVGDIIIINAVATLTGSAGASILIQGESVEAYQNVVGEDAKASQLEALEPDALKLVDMSLEQAIYNHIKATRIEYVDAIDV